MHTISQHTRDRILEFICYLFVLLFVYAAVSKLLDFNTFRNQLGQSPLLSAYAHWIVWVVPAVELLVAIGLSIPRYRTWGLFGFFGTMIMFTTYIVIILNFADFVPCSCGGILEKLGWTEHLIFNASFIALSIITILLSYHKGSGLKKGLWQLSGLAVIGIATVSLLYLGSEKQMKRNNAFIRRYIPHPIKKIGEYDLEYNSYYIAGINSGKVYLGNYTAPLSMTTLGISSGQFEEFHIEIDSIHLPYRRVRISVKHPFFYVGDGTVPILFRGSITDWRANIYSYGDAYFSDYTVSNSNKIGFVTISSESKSRALGLLIHKVDTNQVYLNTSILKKQLYGLFETDGMLLWNDYYQQFIYSYFYSNAFEVFNKTLIPVATGRTIDTISQPVLNVAYYKEKNQYKNGGNSITVNRYSTTYGPYLYINSDRLGRYEDVEILKSASIIDVYAIRNNTYVFSFYLYHQPEMELHEFKIYKDVLVALVDDTIWLYRLKSKYFGFSTTQ